MKLNLFLIILVNFFILNAAEIRKKEIKLFYTPLSSACGISCCKRIFFGRAALDMAHTFNLEVPIQINVDNLEQLIYEFLFEKKIYNGELQLIIFIGNEELDDFSFNASIDLSNINFIRVIEAPFPAFECSSFICK